MDLAGHLRAEKSKVEKMSFKERWSYLWMYYRFWIIGAVVVIGLIIYFGQILLAPRVEPVLHLTLVNFYDDVSQDSEFVQEFCDSLPEQPQKGRVVFDANAFFDLSKMSDYHNSYYQKTVAALEAETTDGVICQYENLMGIAKGGRLLDLRDQRAASIYAEYEAYVICCEDEQGNEIPVGIDLSSSSRWKDLNGYEAECYLGISSKALHLAQIEQFLDFMLGEESNKTK